MRRSRHGRLRISGHTLQVVAGSGSSDAAMSWLRSRILPAVLREPDQWLFLVQESPGCPGSHEADQYSVVGHVAHRLRIPVGRIEHDRPGALEDYYHGRLRRALKAAALRLNRERLRAVLGQYPTRRQVLVLLDDANLPVSLPSLAVPIG